MGTDGARVPADKRNTYPGSVLVLCICTKSLILPQTLVSQNTANSALGNAENKTKTIKKKSTNHQTKHNLDVDLAPAVK